MTGMNLKVWRAMSSLTLAQRRELDEMSTRCCSIRDTLIKQLKDEEEGTIFYAEKAGELGLIGEDGLADTLNSISDNEFIHYLELRGIIDVLTEQCNCERKTIGPFG